MENCVNGVAVESFRNSNNCEVPMHGQLDSDLALCISIPIKLLNSMHNYTNSGTNCYSGKLTP